MTGERHVKFCDIHQADKWLMSFIVYFQNQPFLTNILLFLLLIIISCIVIHIHIIIII